MRDGTQTVNLFSLRSYNLQQCRLPQLQKDELSVWHQVPGLTSFNDILSNNLDQRSQGLLKLFHSPYLCEEFSETVELWAQ